MNKKKDPAQTPGEGARAIDTFRNDYTKNGEWDQAIENVRKFQLEELAEGNNLLEERALMLAYLSGYSPRMPVRVANDIVTKLTRERRHME